MVTRSMADYLQLVWLAGFWRLSDGDDFAVLWGMSRAVAKSVDEEQAE